MSKNMYNKFFFISLKVFIIYLSNFVFSALAQTPIYTTPYTVITIAGNAISGTGYADGAGSNALFNQPCGVVSDGAGNLYVADSGNYVVRKISSNGVVTTIAGIAGINGSSDGAGNMARFGFLGGIAIDTYGNLYLADTTNNSIRKLEQNNNSWNVTTLIASNAGLNQPIGIALDSSNNIYVADLGNAVIRKITPSGNMTTFAGSVGKIGGSDGTGPLASFGSPTTIAIDTNNNIYVTDTGANTIRCVSPQAQVTTIGGYIGSPGFVDGPLDNTKGQFQSPYGIAVDSNGNIFISDSSGTILRKVTSGVVSSVAGKPGYSSRFDGIGSMASFNNMHALCSDSSGNIYIADYGASTVRKAFNAAAAPTPPSITSQLTVMGTIGLAFSYQITATNSPTSFSASNLPPGLSINSSGLISGTPSSSGTFAISISTTNAGGSSSAILNLSVSAAAPTPPSITSQPISQTVTLGSSVVFISSASGTLLSYQWYFNGVLIPGAISSTYTIPSTLASNSGTYTVTVSNSAGTVTSQAAQLSVLNPGRLTNLSVLSLDGPGSQLLTIGFVSGGLGVTGSQNLLIRGIGPAIGVAPFNIPNVLPDPTLTVFNSSTVSVASNDNWGTPASNATAVTAADTATGAFALTSTTSLDAAVVTSLAAGSYTVQVSGKNGASGNVIAEVYDNTPANSYTIITPRLVNISCLEQVASGAVLTAGFVIAGTTPEQVLIRASGPTLATAPFNIPGTIPDPKLTVFNNSSAVLATNTGWGGSAAITAANTASGAFQFVNTTSKDSAVLLTLQPGAYTVQATSASGNTGIVLIEIYEVPIN
jgi:sugar lactone lactonase YvrE